MVEDRSTGYRFHFVIDDMQNEFLSTIDYTSFIKAYILLLGWVVSKRRTLPLRTSENESSKLASSAQRGVNFEGKTLML